MLSNMFKERDRLYAPMPIDPDDYSAIHPQDLPYLELSALQGRPISIYTFHDGSRWKLWVPMENGLLQPLQIADAVEVVYLARKPAHVNDAHFYFLDFIHKHIAVRKADSFISALTSDIFNLGASLRKLDLLRADSTCKGKQRLVSTELEYLLILCRSMFDLLQEVVVRIWETIQLTDISTTKKQLPGSFRKVVLKNGVIRSSQEIQERFGLTPCIATWYSDCAPFFCKLRSARDAIAHQPVHEPVIYVDGRGFSIGVESSPKPFQDMLRWPEEILVKNKVGPLNYFIAYFINETLLACEKFAVAVNQEIKVAPSFAPEHFFFMRSPNMASLQGIRRILKVDPWAEFTIPEQYLLEELEADNIERFSSLDEE